MKQSKFALTAVSLLALIGSALAFKANRQLNNFYAYTTTLVAGRTTGACIPLVQKTYLPFLNGTTILTLSSTQTTGVTTCTVRAISVN